jgi:multidrug efflux pump subunit AcrA (membrane-fusion protein)
MALPDLVSKEELAEAEVELRTGEATLEAAKAVRLERRAAVEQLRRRLARSELRAPFAGRISRRYLDPGATVAPGDPVVRLATTETLRLRFAVPPEEAAELAPGSRVVVMTDDGRPLSRAVVLWIAPEIDPVSQRILVAAVPEDGSPGLHAGLGVRLSSEARAGGPAAGRGSP